MNLKDLYEASRLRVQKQRVLEDYIEKFNPDFMEASELIAALLAGLRSRYEDNLGADLEHELKSLMDLLNKMDMDWPENVRERYEELFQGQRVNDE